MDDNTARTILNVYLGKRRLQIAINESFRIDSTGRTRRGVVSDIISNALGVTVNPQFHAALHEALLAMGARPITVRGRSFWGELSFHPGTCERETET